MSVDRAGAESILRTQNLTRVVSGKTLVDDISIQVRPGEILAVVGPSGAGKSSFLRLLNRLDEPTSGTVFLSGRDYRELPPQELRRRLGMVMQTAHLFPGTVTDNIRFGPAQRGEQLPDARIEELLDRVRLAGFGGRDINRLSGGEAQRVSLARTLANAPQILLLDEPTSALDEASKKDVEDLICEIIRSRGLTSLIVTHDAAQAGRLADRVLVMEAGRLLHFGPAGEVLDAYQAAD